MPRLGRGERWGVPHVVLAELDLASGDMGNARATNAEIHFGGVVPERLGLLAGLEHAECHLNPGREARCRGERRRVHDERGAPAVRWRR